MYSVESSRVFSQDFDTINSIAQWQWEKSCAGEQKSRNSQVEQQQKKSMWQDETENAHSILCGSVGVLLDSIMHGIPHMRIFLKFIAKSELKRKFL